MDVMTKPTRLSAGILLWDGVEMLDWVGPYEVLATATPFEVTQPGALKYYFDPITLARKPAVRCMGDVRVTVDRTLDRAGKLDIVIIPGGPGVLPRDPGRVEPIPSWQRDLIAFIRAHAEAATVVASVCTGAFLFARTGLLEGRRATTHSALLEMFRTECETHNRNITVVPGKIEDNGCGKMVTASGISSGIDFGLYLLHRFHGQSAMQAEARYLDGPWPLPGDTGSCPEI
jgi:transcriptional regulator GlxA family with amidase domain